MYNNTQYSIITDPEYGFLRVDPISSQEEVERYYMEEFYSSDYKRFNDSSLEVQKEEEDFFRNRWESIHTHCVDFFGKTDGLSLLDIGFGFAQALFYFREKGMDVSGLVLQWKGPNTHGRRDWTYSSQVLKIFPAQKENVLMS